MVWWKRLKGGISTPTANKKETPEGLWYNCPSCKSMITSEDHMENFWVCNSCDFHSRIGSQEYFALLFDKEPKILFSELKSSDPLSFKDKKPYKDRITQAIKSTSLNDSIQSAYGKVAGENVLVCCMDFDFIGGSMGSVVGEKISRSIQFCIKKKSPLIIISKSGGARMMEGAFSLMQMAKTSAQLSLLAKQKLPFISILTDPTTGGVSASYAMLGDLNIAEPGALIGFAGPRIIRETIGKDLPEGFQRSEFLLEHGFLDYISHRKELKRNIGLSLKLLNKS